MKMRGELCNIREMAECHEWEEVDHQENIKMVSFMKAGDRINVYYSKMTVGIIKNGKQEFFKHVSEHELSLIFRNENIKQYRKGL